MVDMGKLMRISLPMVLRFSAAACIGYIHDAHTPGVIQARLETQLLYAICAMITVVVARNITTMEVVAL